MEIFREFRFEAAHLLPRLPEGHKCRRLHGHSYRVEVHIEGEVDRVSGMVLDFAGLDEAFEPLRQQLDHYYLNDIEGLDNPTSENLAAWIWQRLTGSLPLCLIVVRETCTSGAEYRGPHQ